MACFLLGENTFALTHWLDLRPPTNSALHEGLGPGIPGPKPLKTGGKKRGHPGGFTLSGDAIGTEEGTLSKIPMPTLALSAAKTGTKSAGPLSQRSVARDSEKAP